MLPLNLYLYITTLYGRSVELDWLHFVLNIVVAISATLCGLGVGVRLGCQIQGGSRLLMI